MQEKNNKYLTFADRLVFAMKDRGLNSPRGETKTQIQPLADAVSVSVEMARRYLLGTAEPKDSDTKRKIAEWLNISYVWLVTGEGEMIETIKETELNGDYLKECIAAVKNEAEKNNIELTDDQVINTAIYLYEERDLLKAKEIIKLFA